LATKTIGSGGDYTTIAAWSVYIKALGTLTESEIGELTDNSNYTWGAASDLNFSAVTLSGFTITLRATTNKHDGDFGTGSRVSTAVDYGRIYDLYNLILNDVELQNTSAENDSRVIRSQFSTVERCLLKVAGTGSGTFVYEVHSDSICKVNRAVGGIVGFHNRIDSNTLQANTATGSVTGFNTTTAHTGSNQNNVAYNCTTDWAGTWSGTNTNNASEDGTHPGTSGVTISGSPFETDGYTPTNAGQLDGAGVNLSISLDAANLSFENPPAIGAYEATAGGGGGGFVVAWAINANKLIMSN
jgi:hypothetical protein